MKSFFNLRVYFHGIQEIENIISNANVAILLRAVHRLIVFEKDERNFVENKK